MKISKLSPAQKRLLLKLTKQDRRYVLKNREFYSAIVLERHKLAKVELFHDDFIIFSHSIETARIFKKGRKVAKELSEINE